MNIHPNALAMRLAPPGYTMQPPHRNAISTYLFIESRVYV